MGEKILIICGVLDVTLYELLGGSDGIGSGSDPSEYILATNDSEYGRALMQFLEQEKGMQGLTFWVYAGIVGDIARREEGIMIMIVEGTGWSPVIMCRNS